MIIGTVTVTRNMRHAAAILVAALTSLVLAMAGWDFRLWLHIFTPGMMIGGWAARSSSISLGGALFTQVAADFVFWFALTFGIYFLAAKLIAGSKRARNARALEGARRLADLGGTMPELKDIPRRRPN
jgi:hypothetical protein